MIYSNEKLQEIKKEFKSQKKRTKWITIGLFALALLIGILTYFVRWFIFIIFGIIATTSAFAYLFFRLTEAHKVYKNEIEFYSDILYSERQVEEVVFVRLAEKIYSNKRLFNSAVVYRLKTESNYTLIYDEKYDLNMEQNKRYIITKVNNVLIDYKGKEDE